MEEDQEQKHVCKFCRKRFPCGRSLGGHMRSHMTMNLADTEENLSKRKAASATANGGSNNSSSFVGFEANGGHACYGLRENPKKTWRLSDSKDGLVRQGKFCKECGKGFQSWKALFGHMRCHSEKDKERVSNHSLEDDSWTSENQKLVMDSQSDNEGAAAPRRRRRSRRMRYKTVTASSSFSVANASSSVSEIEQEQEEVAMCLMMLSRDVGHWGGLNSVVAESSDNNSMVLEAGTRSSALDKRIPGKFAFDDGDETLIKSLKIKKPRDKKLERRRSEFQGNDFGFLKDDLKKVESEVSVDGFLRDDELKNTKLEDGAELGKDFSSNRKYNRKKSTLDYSEAELGNDSIEEVGMNRADSELGKYNSRKRSRSEAYYTELGGDSSKKMKHDASDSGICRDSHKRSRFECTTCSKTFHSYQALGGHRASHKKVKGCFASKIESSENSIDTDVSPDPTADSKINKSCSNETLIEEEDIAETSYGSKKSKGHECPICFKVFASGQALGGHKRSHLVGGSEYRCNQTIVIQQQLPEIRDLLDLNLPAPVEEETSGHMDFNPWWVRNNPKHEPFVGLISN
ncbi:uncharacterized protein LOC122076169 [Macadamia integrifolia]|uniref:uncharacterized protein LOC122076169 n=1 Tax=Macadamia integrifolia TaxID=60698 RepID=UPI001C500594|nr:uncharacterized protein LOC122076169 [Macadamia integrifolia]